MKKKRLKKKTFKKISNFLKSKKIRYKEIIFVDDGSEDNSSKIILEFIKRFKKSKFLKLKLVKYKYNL